MMKPSKTLFSGCWGLEREVLRVDQEGRLSRKPHPFPPDERQITVDFAEAQAELISGVHETPLGALDELAELQERLLAAAPGELLWPFSLPGRWVGEDAVDIARFAGDPRWEDQRQYRERLAVTHGKARQVISGIHVNYSFGPDHPGGDYFALIRNFLRYKPLLTFLLAGSPWLEESMEADLSRQRPNAVAVHGQCLREFTASVRLGPLGYGLDPEVEAKLDVRFDSLEEYVEKLERAIRPRDGGQPLLQHEREYYAPIRPKAASGDKGRTLEALRNSGVRYLEFRVFDLDPFAPMGISEETLLFFQLFVMACSMMPSPRLRPEERRRTSVLDHSLAVCGLSKDAHRWPALRELAHRIFPLLERLASLGSDDHQGAVAWFRRQMQGETPRPIDRLRSLWGADPTAPLTWGLDRARLHHAWHGLELSTRALIREADARGIRVTLLDPVDNFLALEANGRTEYVKQATRTSADSYVTALLMENKLVTKRLLERAGLDVPPGACYSDKAEAMAARDLFAGDKTVVKPNSTNYGQGVSILDADAPPASWNRAVEVAFGLDRQILVERFVSGLEFRFLVIGDKTRAVLHRVPANVVGDGVRTIRELVEEKNRNPLRGEHYRKPLEKIRLQDVEVGFLAAQGLTPEWIPKPGQTVFLRENSNISTGGDSIDYTDRMPAIYHRRAELAAKALGANICGVDIVIPDWRDARPEAASVILELNFNPALHIHDFPAVGVNRRVEKHVLDLLGLVSGRVSRDGQTRMSSVHHGCARATSRDPEEVPDLAADSVSID